MKILSFKQILVIFVFLFSIIYSLPTFYKEVPTWLSSVNAKKMNLGLDLKGGVHFLMEVDLDEVVNSKSKKFSSDIRSQLRKNKIRYRNYNYQSNSIEIEFVDDNSYEKVEDLIKKHKDLDDSLKK